MREPMHVRSGLAIAALLLLGGCATTRIAYKPMAGTPGAAKGTVALKVVDQRPADKGGQEKNQVGQVRGKYGIPSAVKDASTEVATRTVADATTDALRQAGIGVQ